MILNDRDIKALVKMGDLGIDPFNEACVQPASYDFHIADEWLGIGLAPGRKFLDLLDADVDLEGYYQQEPTYILQPNAFVLARTVEVFKFPKNVAGKVWTRSSLGRLGLRVANDAGFCDPGFHGNIVLEVRNDGPIPICLQAGMRVGQVSFFLCTDNATNPYSGSYQGQFSFNFDKLQNSLMKAANEAAERIK